MNAEEAGELVALMAMYDNRKVSDPDIIAWLKVIGDLSYADCEAAALAHYRESRERIMPADVRTRVKAMRRNRLERELVPAPPAELTDNPGRYRAWIAAAVNRIADSRSLRRALEPSQQGGPPEGFTKTRRALGAGITPIRRLSPQELAAQQAAESRKEREAHKDADA